VRLRLGLIVPGFSADQTDWCIPAVRDLVRELAGRHDVHVFALRYPHRVSRYQVDGATVQSFGGALARRGARVRLLARALAGIMAEHRRQPFDVLHGLWADEPGVLAVAAGARLGVPPVVSLMGGELVGLDDIGYGGQLGLVNRTMTRQSIRRAARVTTGSAYLRTLAESQPEGDRVLRLPLGVDVRRFHPDPGDDAMIPLLQGQPRLLHVASLVPVKDQETLLRALSLIAGRAPDVHLHVVGEGPLLGHLRRRAAALEITARITFHGAVLHDHLPGYYHAADLCVLSSRHESQGMVVLEAAACGRATVGTAVGILPELAHPDHAVPVGDAHALADTVATLAEDPEALALAGRIALERVTARYTLDRSVAELCALYRMVIGR
jgi:glycosyltransferase involved in cell wall biosynthesis